MVVLLVGGVLASGCDAGPRPTLSPNRLDAPIHPPLPPSDGLLDNPALQTVVDGQAGGTPTELLRAIYSSDATVTARGLFAMGSMREVFASQAIRERLSHPDSTVRQAAAFALGQLPRPESTPWIWIALDEETDVEARSAMVTALGKAGDEAAADSLVAAALDVPESVMILALARLALRHDPSPPVLDRLLSALESPDGELREYAAWYFGRSGDATAWSPGLERVRAALGTSQLDDPAAAGLLRALGRRAEPTDLDGILRFQESPDWRLRVRTAAALTGFVSQDTARQTLFHLLDDPSTHVSVAAATSLGEIRRILAPDLDRIERWIDAHPSQWRAAMPLLGALAREGRVGFVSTWLDDRPDASTGMRAAWTLALAQTADQSVTRRLMALATSDTTEIAVAALQGLVERWDGDRDNREIHRAYWDTFSEAMEGGDMAVVATVAPALADEVFQQLGAMDLMARVFSGLTPVQDLEAQQAIVRAVGAIGDPRGLVILEAAMADPHRTLRLEAAGLYRPLAQQQVEPDRAINPPARMPDWALLRELGPHPVLILETEKGTVRIRMTTELTPVTVQTVREFAEAGLYDGVRFHRVIPDFVIQGGDFGRGDGFGGPGFALRTEISGVPFVRGVVGLAASGMDTEGSQFFVTHSRQPHLDDNYVAFGWVEEGMDVVDTIYQDDVVLSARVESDTPPQP